MTNRYHLPIVVTTDDEMDRAETIKYVERVLASLEDTEHVHRTYVENSGIDDGEAERLLDMLSRIEDGSIDSAIEAIDTIAEDEEDTE